MSVIRVLIVDDVESWRKFVCATLNDETSFDIVCEASDGMKAVQMAERLQPTIVLLDIGLPKLSGIQAATWIRKLAPKTRIVILSEHLDVEIARAAFTLGACGYVLKSDAARELVAAIHAVVRGEQFVSQQLAGYGLIADRE